MHRPLLLLLLACLVGCDRLLPVGPGGLEGRAWDGPSSRERSGSLDRPGGKDARPGLDQRSERRPNDGRPADRNTIKTDAASCSSFPAWTQLYCDLNAKGCSYSCSAGGSTYVVSCDPIGLPTRVALCTCTVNGGTIAVCGPRHEKNNTCYYPCNYWATIVSCCPNL